MVNNPSYHLSKFIANILKKSQNSTYSIKSPQELQNMLNNLTIKQDDKLFSLDVESLYTNVDSNLVIKIINEKWREIENNTPIDKDMFIEIIKFCVEDCNYFSIDNKIFTQKFGLAMGNPISGVLAEMALDYIIEKAVNRIDRKPTLIKKYVDDILCIIPDNEITKLLNYFNNTHEKLKFTIEGEKNKRIPFLDMLLIRNTDLTISTDWYCKPCSSNRILNYLSNHPYNTKVNTAKSFAYRVLSASHKVFHRTNINKIYSILKKNNYPNHVIHKIIKNTKYKLNSNNINTLNNMTTGNNPNIQLDNTQPIYKSLPFIHPVSTKISRIIKESCQEMNITYKPTNQIKQIYTKTKDKVTPQEQSNVVYKVECSGCPSAYIGQTSKKLNTRLGQHKKYIEKEAPRSALATHSIDTGHTFNFDQAYILEIEENKKRREMKEACHIYMNKNNIVNIKQDLETIDKDYHLLLSRM